MAGGGDDGPKKEYPWYYGFIAFLCFATGNISLNYFNSWAIRPSPVHIPGVGKGDFDFPFFYTMWHMLASAIAALIMQLTCNKPKTGSPYPTLSQLWEYKWQLVPIGCLTVLNNGFNNVSLGMVALFVNQVIKATGPAPTALFEFLLMGKVYNLAIYTSVLCIVGGSALANYSEFGSGNASQLMGIVFVLISTFAASLRPVLQRLLVSSDKARGEKEAKPPLTVPQAMFWDTGIAFIGMAIVWVSSAERDASIAYLQGHTANPNSGWLALGMIAASSCMAFFFNFATYYFILYTSALSSTIGSNAVKILIIVATAFTDTADTGGLDVVSWCGVLGVILSICLYTFFQHQFKQAQAAKAEADKANPLASKADEATPLNASRGDSKV